MGKCREWWDRMYAHFVRMKIVVPDEVDAVMQEVQLNKCLTMFDLVSLGTASCVGSGIYIVIGFITKRIAGPGIMLSFLFGGIASLFSGLCYAEFGGRVPKTAGGAYVYSYVTVGELIGFITGWNLILEYMIGTSSGAVALSAMLNDLTGFKYSEWMTAHSFPVWDRSYPDVVGFGICLLMAGLLASGVKNSINFNNALNTVNFVVWFFMCCVGAFYARPSYWAEFGFLPYGFSGVMSGAATCFYAFIGFDIIATTGEEAKNAAKIIPIAVVLTLCLCITVYVSMSAIITLMIPYYDIVSNAAIVSVWEQRAVPGVQYVVMIGGLAGLIVSLLGSAFPMPRIIYAMGCDGVIFKWFAVVNKYTMAPVNATFASGLMGGLLALFIGLDALIEMMSIGTLLAYTMVSVSILLLRYRPNLEDEAYINEVVNMKTFNSDGGADGKANEFHDNPADEESPITKSGEEGERKKFYGTYGGEPQFVGLDKAERHALYEKFRYDWGFCGFKKIRRSTVATEETSDTVLKTLAVLTMFVLYTDLCLVAGEGALTNLAPWIFVMVFIGFVGVILCVAYIRLQPQSRKRLPFMTPGLPYIPCLALFCNCYLVMKLSPFTWIRFAVWMAIGFGIYFGYGIKVAPKIYEERMAILQKLSEQGLDAMMAEKEKGLDQESATSSFQEDEKKLLPD